MKVIKEVDVNGENLKLVETSSIGFSVVYEYEGQQVYVGDASSKASGLQLLKMYVEGTKRRQASA